MGKLRFTLAFLAATLAFAALAVGLIYWSDGDANAGDSERSAALNEYFARMSEIDDEGDRQFEKSVFGVSQESARSYAESFDAVLAMLEKRYEAVSPPSEVEEQHAALIEAIRGYRIGIDHGVKPLDLGAPPGEFEALFSDVLADEDQRASSAFCKIQEVATAEGIKADVGCQGA